MQERNRESSKRRHKSRFDARRVSKKNSSKAKSKELNPVEKRNQRIEENKKSRGGQIIDQKIIYPKKVAYQKKVKRLMPQRSEFKTRASVTLQKKQLLR